MASSEASHRRHSVPAILIAAALAVSQIVAARAHAATLTVDPSAGPHRTIASALGQAKAGDTVVLKPGIYREAVRLPSGVSLKGEGLARIAGDSPVTISEAENVNLSGITAILSPAKEETDKRSAIAVSSSKNVKISETRVEPGAGLGVSVASSAGVSVDGVTIVGVGAGTGLSATGSEISVINSSFSSLETGLSLADKSKGRISGNLFDANVLGLAVRKSTAEITRNSVTGGGIEKSQRGVMILGSPGLVADNAIRRNRIGIFALTDGVTIRNNVVSQNAFGVLVNSFDARIALNRIDYNHGDGMVLLGTKPVDRSKPPTGSAPVVFGNIISSNGGRGILLTKYPNAVLRMNLLEANRVGVALDSARARIENNTVVYSTQEGISVAEGASGQVKSNLVAFNRFGVRKGSDAELALEGNNVFGNFARRKFPVQDGNYARSMWLETLSGDAYLASVSPAKDVKGKTDISVDPVFVAPGSDYRLSPKSPLADMAKSGKLIGAFPVAKQ